MKKIIVSTILSLLVISSFGQQVKRALNHDDIESWNRITEKTLSNDGNWIIYQTEPWKGDSRLYISDSEGNEIANYPCGTGASVSFDSKFVAFRLKPSYDEVRKLKLEKTDKKDMPGDKLVIYNPASQKEKIIDNLRNFKFPEKWSGWVAYQTENDKTGNGQDEKDKKEKKQSSKNGYALKLLNLEDESVTEIPYVKYYSFVKESPALLIVSTGDNDFKAGLWMMNLEDGSRNLLLESDDDFVQVTAADDGSMVAFLEGSTTATGIDEFSLFLSKGSGNTKAIVTNTNKSLPDGFSVSKNGRISFSEDGEKLFFGTAPVKPEKDTMRLEEDWPVVDIWGGSEGKLHTVQILDRERDMRKSYTAVYHINSDKIIQLGSPDVPDIQLIKHGDSDWALGLSNLPYELQSMWEGGPRHYDIYLIDVNNGDRKIVKKDVRARVQPSPAGKYLAWYDYVEASYYTCDLEDFSVIKVTDPSSVNVADELNDVPNLASPYPPTGWLEDDEAFLVNDRYDIWRIDPSGKSSPENLTGNGRENMTSYSMVWFDRDKETIGNRETLLLEGFNERTRGSGYYSFRLGRDKNPALLLGGNYKLSTPIKAKNADVVLYTSETFNQFPDLLVTDLSFRKSQRVSNANPQQGQFKWGTAELVSWVSLDGKNIEGLLYKPENFDPSKKYPMIVNFYEKSSNGLYSYRTPELHRSTIDYHYYTSNGYLIFNPDIYYIDGYPGQSAYNCIMPGITALIDKGFVDKDHIGAQGHSWGGYQVAYLATRTNLFAAIESGAPVVNMYSAYGGIRWWTGLNRSFQYEHTQSRIGGSIWEAPLKYLENSPLFSMDKVNTPILIMSNDKDGHVPWWQGIEYFIALRRLQKPVWLLNYNGEPHWPQKLQNKKDFQIRMAQFFDHYLKEKSAPKWMKEGVPAVMKDFELGYELSEK